MVLTSCTMLSLLSVASTFARRASICESLTRTGSCSGPAVEHAASGRTPSRASTVRSIRIDELDPSILRPRRLIVPQFLRTLFAVAHGRQLRAARALQLQDLPHRSEE